jgi:Tn3 transposase DDE domain
LLLEHFEFHAARAATELLQALDLLRDLNTSGKRSLPERVPTGFVKPRWRPHVFKAEGVDRHFYELCALAELRDRLRSGDIWVTGSRQYRDFETYLIPATAFKAMQQQEPLPLSIDTEFTSYIAERREKLQEDMASVASKARENTLPDVTLTEGDLRIVPLRKNTPESAEAFAEKAYALMPHAKITEVLEEVDQWTGLGDQFLHLRTQTPPKNRQALLTAILADGINLGLARMSEACRETTWRQLVVDRRLARAGGVLRTGPCRADRCTAPASPCLLIGAAATPYSTGVFFRACSVRFGIVGGFLDSKGEAEESGQ